MMTRKIPFFEYPRLWTDSKQEYISKHDLHDFYVERHPKAKPLFSFT